MSSNQPSAGNIYDKQGSSTPTSDAITKAYTLVSEGNELTNTAKFIEAIEKYTRAITLYRFPIFFCNRANAYLCVGRFDDTINDCHAAIKLDPKCAKAFEYMGYAFTVQKRFNDAKEAYKKALECEPGNEEYKRDLATAEEMLKASKHDPLSKEVISNANAFKEEGNVCLKDSKFDEAVEKYTKALELKRDPVYLTNRAAAFCHLKKYTDAGKDCREAMSIDPFYAKTHGRMGFIASCLGDYFGAVEYYKCAFQMDPNNQNYKENLDLAETKLREEANQRT